MSTYSPKYSLNATMEEKAKAFEWLRREALKGAKGNRHAAVLLEELSARSEIAHTDHPSRHWDRTCPACIAQPNAAAQTQELPAAASKPQIAEANPAEQAGGATKLSGLVTSAQQHAPASAAPYDDKSQTPRTDTLIAKLDADHSVGVTFVWRQMVNLCRQLERELNAARSATRATAPVRIVGIITYDWLRRVARQESMKYLEGTESPEDVVRVVLDAVQELTSSDSGSDK